MTSRLPSSAVPDNPMDTHALLINLGRGNPRTPTGYDVTTYTFDDGAEVTTSLAGLALWRWLVDHDKAPRSVVFACTAVAWRDKEQAVRADVLNLELPPERLAPTIPLEIPRSSEQVWATFPPIEHWLAGLGAAPGNPVTLHMDLTHAYRAIPIAHTWMALYLQRRGMIIPGVWGYGAFEPGVPGPTPFLDLSHLLELAEWATAVEDVEHRLDARRLAALLKAPADNERRRAWADGQPAEETAAAHQTIGRLVTAASSAGRLFPSNLPLELGLAVGQSLHGLSGGLVDQSGASVMPQHRALLARLHEVLVPLAIPTSRRDQPKTEITLNQAEIWRQVALVERWLAVGDTGAALRALREVMVNRILLAWRCSPGDWLTASWRKTAEKALHSEARGGSQVHAASSRVGRLWEQLCNARNPYAHCAMEERRMDPSTQAGEARQRLDALSALLLEDTEWDLPVPTATDPVSS